MNKLTAARQAAIIQALVEGSSIRATCRMTATAKGTVLRLAAEIGEACYGRRAHWSRMDGGRSGRPARPKSDRM